MRPQEPVISYNIKNNFVARRRRNSAHKHVDVVRKLMTFWSMSSANVSTDTANAVL